MLIILNLLVFSGGTFTRIKVSINFQINCFHMLAQGKVNLKEFKTYGQRWIKSMNLFMRQNILLFWMVFEEMQKGKTAELNSAMCNTERSGRF